MLKILRFLILFSLPAFTQEQILITLEDDHLYPVPELSNNTIYQASLDYSPFDALLGYDIEKKLHAFFPLPSLELPISPEKTAISYGIEGVISDQGFTSFALSTRGLHWGVLGKYQEQGMASLDYANERAYGKIAYHWNENRLLFSTALFPFRSIDYEMQFTTISNFEQWDFSLVQDIYPLFFQSQLGFSGGDLSYFALAYNRVYDNSPQKIGLLYEADPFFLHPDVALNYFFPSTRLFLWMKPSKEDTWLNQGGFQLFHYWGVFKILYAHENTFSLSNPTWSTFRGVETFGLYSNEQPEAAPWHLVGNLHYSKDQFYFVLKGEFPLFFSSNLFVTIRSQASFLKDSPEYLVQLMGQFSIFSPSIGYKVEDEKWFIILSLDL